MVVQRACAFVTYTTREAAEKAAEELSNRLVVKGLRLKLMWGRPQAPKQNLEGTDEARKHAVAHSGLLPRAVISQQQNQLQDQSAPPGQHYYNMPPPPSQERTYYPSMDPQRMGAVVRSQDGAPSGLRGSGETSSGSERQHYAFQSMAPAHGQYNQQFYPPQPYSGYMPPPAYQQYPPQYHAAVPPQSSLPMNQHYQHSATPGTAPSGPISSVPAQSNSGPSESTASGSGSGPGPGPGPGPGHASTGSSQQ